MADSPTSENEGTTSTPHFGCCGYQDVGNPYIRSGHRRTPLSVWNCFKTAFSLHNETTNIWSHALGSIYFAKCATHGPTPARFAAGCSAITYFLSAFAHTFGALSPYWNDILFRLDRSGIANFLYSCSVACTLIHFRGKGAKLFYQKLAMLFGSTVVHLATVRAFMLGADEKLTSVRLLAMQILVGVAVVLSELRSTTSETVKRLVYVYFSLCVWM